MRAGRCCRCSRHPRAEHADQVDLQQGGHVVAASRAAASLVASERCSPAPPRVSSPPGDEVLAGQGLSPATSEPNSRSRAVGVLPSPAVAHQPPLLDHRGRNSPESVSRRTVLGRLPFCSRTLTTSGQEVSGTARTSERHGRLLAPEHFGRACSVSEARLRRAISVESPGGHDGRDSRREAIELPRCRRRVQAHGDPVARRLARLKPR